MQDKQDTICDVPVSLLKTWVWMVTESDDPSLIDQGTDNLIQQFNSITEARDFIESYE